MKTLRDEIRELSIYHSSEGTSGYLLSEKQVDSIMTLIQQEVRECIGEDESEQIISSCIHGITSPNVHRNKLRSDIREKLKERGLL
jgi:hypothetical protein